MKQKLALVKKKLDKNLIWAKIWKITINQSWILKITKN